MKFAKWLLKLAALVAIFCTGGFVGVAIYCLIIDGDDNIVLNLLADILSPIDRALS
jgi:hypothetical protein